MTFTVKGSARYVDFKIKRLKAICNLGLQCIWGNAVIHKQNLLFSLLLKCGDIIYASTGLTLFHYQKLVLEGEEKFKISRLLSGHLCCSREWLQKRDLFAGLSNSAFLSYEEPCARPGKRLLYEYPRGIAFLRLTLGRNWENQGI